ncbi:hypothetical protein DSUL_160101 [Desulfovibrionales bacterium]
MCIAFFVIRQRFHMLSLALYKPDCCDVYIFVQFLIW